MKNEEPQMFIMYHGDTPYKYYYGLYYTPLLLDEGYPTPEEAKAAWEKERSNSSNG